MGTSLLDARLGGRVVSCGKLDGAMEALDLECTSRDVLLVTSQLGDLIEAALGIQGGKMLRGGPKIVLNWFGCEMCVFTLKLDLKGSFFDNRNHVSKELEVSNEEDCLSSKSDVLPLMETSQSQRNLLETEASQQGADVRKLRPWLVGRAATPCDVSD